MKQVYDNGEMVLGQVYYVKNYIARNISTSDMKEELYEITGHPARWASKHGIPKPS